MKKRMKAAAAAMALAMLCGALPAVPGGAELLNTPLTANAAGSVTLENGVLTLSGAVTKEQIWEYKKNNAVKSVVARENCVLPEDCSYLFFRRYDFDTEEKYDFWVGLTKIDLSKADTSQVTDMRAMFAEEWDYVGHEQITDYYTVLGLDHFDTSNVTNMKAMFYGHQGEQLDLRSFDTSNVTSMQGMFEECKNLTSLNLSTFDTSNVTDMSEMFCDCKNLTLLNLSTFDTSNITDMSEMFRDCENLTLLNLSSFDTSSVTSMRSMFASCTNLNSLNLSTFDTSIVKDMRAMFYDCGNLTSLDLSSFDTSDVTDMSYMFYYCAALETIYVSDFWNTDAVSSSAWMFSAFSNLKGGNGTVYDKNHVDKEYARIDGKDGKPGYLTYKEYQCPGSYVKGVSLGLADQIGVTFYVNMNEQVKKAVLAGVPGEVTVTSFNQLLSGDYKGCVKLVYPVNATEARHTITLRLYDKDGKQLRLYNSDLRRAPKDTISFSVQDYLEQAPQYYPDNEKAQKLAAALSNYCNAASNYFCGKNYTVEGIENVTANSFAGFGVPLYGLKLSLVLNSKTEFRVYGIGDTDNYIARIGTLSNLIYDAEGGYHKITGLKPDELVYPDEYLINGEYVVISPLTYGYYVMKNSNDEALKTVVRALYVYATTARDYNSKDHG